MRLFSSVPIPKRRTDAAATLLLLVVLPVTACTAVVGGAGGGNAGGAHEAAFRVAVISDMNSAYGSTAYGPEVAEAVSLIRASWRPRLVLAAGDMIAGQRPSLTDDNVRAMWAAFDSVVAAPLRAAGIPFGFTLGNHDGSAYPAHARDRAFAAEHWRAPGRDPGLTFVDRTHFPVFYSFRQGPLFVISWDAASANTFSEPERLDWLRAQLSSDAARAAAFRIVLGHLPLYAVAEGRDRPGEVLDDPDMLRALLEQYGVHSYISGHHHAYYPGRRGAVELLHTGALGDGPRPLLGSTTPSPRTVALLDFFPATGQVAYTTWAIEAGRAPVPIVTESLPPRLDGHNGHVIRRDLR
jgi:hypothetical protein